MKNLGRIYSLTGLVLTQRIELDDRRSDLKFPTRPQVRLQTDSLYTQIDETFLDESCDEESEEELSLSLIIVTPHGNIDDLAITITSSKVEQDLRHCSSATGLGKKSRFASRSSRLEDFSVSRQIIVLALFQRTDLLND